MAHTEGHSGGVAVTFAFCQDLGSDLHRSLVFSALSLSEDLTLSSLTVAEMFPGFHEF